MSSIFFKCGQHSDVALIFSMKISLQHLPSHFAGTLLPWEARHPNLTRYGRQPRWEEEMPELCVQLCTAEDSPKRSARKDALAHSRSLIHFKKSKLQEGPSSESVPCHAVKTQQMAFEV